MQRQLVTDTEKDVELVRKLLEGSEYEVVKIHESDMMKYSVRIPYHSEPKIVLEAVKLFGGTMTQKNTWSTKEFDIMAPISFKELWDLVAEDNVTMQLLEGEH